MFTPTTIPQAPVLKPAAFTLAGPVQIIAPKLDLLFQVWHQTPASKVQ